MKVAERIALWLEEQGLTHVFGVSGGANLHLIHGISDVTRIQFIPTTHECNAGFAADAYSRLTGFGCAIATSGPGATNLVTSIAASYYDSAPVLYITGQVATFRRGENFGVKAYGFQETPITEIVGPITKYCAEAPTPAHVIDILESALWAMRGMGRKGPALISIPDDLQRAEI